jgi:hypothetical protein
MIRAAAALGIILAIAAAPAAAPAAAADPGIGGIGGIGGNPGGGNGPNLNPDVNVSAGASLLFMCPGVGAAANVIGGGGGYCDWGFSAEGHY